MKITKDWGMLLLGIWLILSGVMPLFRVSFTGLDTIMALLAIVAGALIIWGGGKAAAA